MSNDLQKKSNIFNNFVWFYLFAAALLWIKTYIVQLTQFNLGVESALQQFLLFLNPLGSALLFLGLAAFFKGRRKYAALVSIHSLLSLLLYSNVVYYRSFTDFITLPTITQVRNFGDLGGSILALMEPYDILMFLDVILIVSLIAFKFVKIDLTNLNKRKVAALLFFALGISSTNLAIAETDRPELLTRGFDRNYIVKYLGMYNYTIYDMVQSTKASAQRVMADSNDVIEVVNFTKSNYAEPNPKYFGIGEGMNVIYIHLESIQEFLIGYELHGEEVTPFLNSLTRDENTLYFDNFFHQTAQGKTADAEFLIENSLYGLAQGAAFTTKGLNTYHAAPAILKEYGYTSAVFHGNSGSFWNRNEIYKSFGYDYFFDESYYELTPENTAEYGLEDKPFFEQSKKLIETLPEPFYAKFITVSHHYPYTIDQEKTTIEPHYTGDKSVDNYFQTARYADEALKEFFDYLKETGLIDRSIIIMYGDHYGISQNHDKAMEIVLDKEITKFDSAAALQRVPLFIRVPGMEGGINHEYGGQIDLLPTLLHLLGIEGKDFVHLGTDLLSENHDNIVPFRNGDFVSPDITSVNGHFYDSNSGLELDESLLEIAEQYEEIAEEKLALSDKIVNGDLLRFYTPNNFTPVDRSDYNYSDPEKFFRINGITVNKEDENSGELEEQEETGEKDSARDTEIEEE